MRALRPAIEIVGVQTVRFPAMFNLIKGTQHPQGSNTIAEGIAVGVPGQLTRQLVAERVDDMMLVDEDDIEQAIVMLLEIEKTRNPMAYPEAAGSLLPIVSADFRERSRQIAERRVVAAGYRLGWLLEAGLGARVSRETH